MMAVQETVKKWNVSRAQAAKRLKITRPRLNDLLHGKISKFSLDALVKIATNAGLSVRMRIGKAAA